MPSVTARKLLMSDSMTSPKPLHVSGERTISSDTRETGVEQLKKQGDVKKALKQTSQPRTRTRQKVYFGAYLLVLVVLSAIYYFLRLQVVNLAPGPLAFLERATIGAIAIATVATVFKIVDVFLIEQVDDPVAEYNIRRVSKLISWFLILLIAVSVLFVNWYTAVVSVGVLSVVAGLALQTTFTSFIGWIYILIRAPFRVGDRIKIGDETGDVIDVGYLDTTLWEFGGDFLSTDHPSGRVIRFSNSTVLNSAVYNYSWPLFPYIWNEIKFNVAYESDLEFIASTLQEVAQEELGKAMLERVRTFRTLLSETPVDQLEVREHPSVVFRVSENTWLEAIVRYVVPPKQAGRVKTRLVRKMLERLNAAPDRVMFPKSNAR